MSFLFTTLVYQPLYNGLVALIELFPGLDLGLVVILFTVIIKLVLFPLSLRAIKAQQELKAIEPDLKALREKYKDNKEQQALKTLELYKERNIKPFSGLLLMLIQLPIIFGLYYIFLRSGLPEINPELLYAFIPTPDHLPSTQFLGLVDITSKSIIFAVIAGAFQYLQTRLSMPATPAAAPGEAPSFGTEFAKSLSFQMRYIFPVIIAFMAYTLGAVIAIYFAASSLFHVFQELYVKRVRERSLQASGAHA